MKLQLDKSLPKQALLSENGYIFVEFNAWLYQGYDDAQEALLGDRCANAATGGGCQEYGLQVIRSRTS